MILLGPAPIALATAWRRVGLTKGNVRFEKGWRLGGLTWKLDNGDHTVNIRNNAGEVGIQQIAEVIWCSQYGARTRCISYYLLTLWVFGARPDNIVVEMPLTTLALMTMGCVARTLSLSPSMNSFS